MRSGRFSSVPVMSTLEKSYCILNKRAHSAQSTTHPEENILYDDQDNEDFLSRNNKHTDENNVGYPGSRFAYFPLGFAHKGDQRRSKRDQDRTRRALSNALYTFPLTPPQIPEKSKILSENNEKNATHLVNPTTIRPLRGPKPQTYIDR